MRHAHRISAAVAAGLCLALAGCLEYRGLKFSHKRHASEAACADCHKGGAKANHAACLSCHEIDEKTPSEKCLTCHAKGDYKVEAARPRSYADVRFNHAAHEGVACERCHAAAKSSRKVSDSIRPVMVECAGCHDGRSAPDACSTCHEKTRKEVKPESHTSLWSKGHGRASAGEASCTYCHSKAGCDECHSTRRPANHTPAWKNSLHGIAANHDRDPCAACHRADECSRCHSMRPPSHYGAGFVNYASSAPAAQGHARLVADRGARSCSACHARSFCLTCHPGGF